MSTISKIEEVLTVIKIKAQPLTAQDFAPFGTFTNLLNPEGDFLAGPCHKFYRDNSRFYSDFSLPVGLSPLVVQKQPLEISASEYHNRTCEGILPMNDDALVHVSPAGGEYDVSKTKVFLVPKGTMLTLYPGVWHLCPLPATQPQLNCLIMLPERAYTNDFYIVDLDDDNKFEIIP